MSGFNWGMALSILAVWILASIPFSIAVGLFIAAGKGKRRTERSTEWASTHDLGIAVGFTTVCALCALGVLA